jgi:hypothetical protein
MTMESGRPEADELHEVPAVLREWQHEGASMQLHPTCRISKRSNRSGTH